MVNIRGAVNMLTDFAEVCNRTGTTFQDNCLYTKNNIGGLKHGYNKKEQYPSI